MYDVGGKLFSGIKSIYVDSLICARVKEGESDWFRINSDVRQGESCPLSSSIYIWTQR